MSPESAKIVFYSIAAGAALLWLVGVLFMGATTRRCRRTRLGDDPMDPSDSADGFFTADMDSRPSGFRITGSVEIDGHPEVLANRAAAVLASGSSPVGPVRIIEKTDRRIVFSTVNPPRQVRMQRKSIGPCQVKPATIEFQPAGGGRTRVTFDAQLGVVGVLLKFGWGLIIAGAAAIGIGGWAIATFVVTSDHAAVRGQAFQIFQAIHFLWPPFLFGGLARLYHRTTGESLLAMIENLPYGEEGMTVRR